MTASRNLIWPKPKNNLRRSMECLKIAKFITIHANKIIGLAISFAISLASNFNSNFLN